MLLVVVKLPNLSKFLVIFKEEGEVVVWNINIEVSTVLLMLFLSLTSSRESV